MCTVLPLLVSGNQDRASRSLFSGASSQVHVCSSAVAVGKGLAEILAYGGNTGSVCLYMAHGGTNFGFWAGSNNGLMDITSYDYDCPIAENGCVGQPGIGGYNKYKVCIAICQWSVAPHMSLNPHRNVSFQPATFHCTGTSRCQDHFKGMMTLRQLNWHARLIAGVEQHYRGCNWCDARSSTF